MLAHRIEHRVDRALQIPVVLAKDILEQLQTIGVDEVVQNDGVVQLSGRELFEQPGL